MLRIVSLVPLIAFLAVAGCRTVPTGAPQTDEGLLLQYPKVLVGELDNGVRYMIRENARPSGRVEMRLAVNAGSVLEKDDQQGLAHLLEHMAFNGTRHFAEQDLIRYLEGIGMRFGPDLNAYTSFDETVYILQVPTDSEDAVETGFKILSDWAFGISNEDEEIEKERGVVIEEWRLRRGASARLRDQHLPVLLHDSRYAERLPIGTIEVLQSFTPDRVRVFFDDWYRPDLMHVVVVGDMPTEQAEAYIERFFGAEPSAASDARERVAYTVPDHGKTLVSIASDPEATQSTISIYYKQDVRIDRTVPDYRATLVEHLFTSMLNNRFDEIRQRAHAPFVSASSSLGGFTRGAAFFSLSAHAHEGHLIPALEAALAEAQRARIHGFTESEFERAKANRMADMRRAYNERDNMESGVFVRSYVQDLLVGSVSPGIEKEYELYQTLLPTISLDEIHEWIGEWMASQSRVVLVSGPEKEGVAMPQEADVLAVLDAVKPDELEPWVDTADDRPFVESLPPRGSIVAEEQIESLEVTNWTLSNGARVIVKPTSFKQDQILFRAYRAGGTSVAPDEFYIPASTADSVVQSTGIGEFSAIQMRNRLSGRNVSVVAYQEELRDAMNGEASPEDLETLFELIHLYYQAPRADADAFDALLQRRRAELLNRASSPEAIYSDAVNRILYQDHPRRQPPDMAMLEEMDMAKSLAFFDERFSNAHGATFLFVGNVEVASLRDLVEIYLASLPGQEDEDHWVDRDVRMVEGKIEHLIRAGREPQSRVQMVYHGPFEWNYANRHMMYSMNDVLNIILREEIREKMSGTYSIRAFAQPEKDPEERYTIRIAFGCDPEQVDILVDAVLDLLEQFMTEPVDEEYIQRVQQTQLRSREVQLEENQFWAFILSALTWYGEDPAIVLDYPEYVASITPESVRDTARRYFGTGNRAIFKLFPANEE